MNVKTTERVVLGDYSCSIQGNCLGVFALHGLISFFVRADKDLTIRGLGNERTKVLG